MSLLSECLGFASDGKLEKLCLAGCPNLLNEWEHEIDLGGKLFQPAGWDECFPTIDPYKENPVMGDLIGLAPEINWQKKYVEQTWNSPRFEARRRFRMESPFQLEMSFQVINRQNAPLEFLWASHTLFGVGNLQKLRLANGTEFTDFNNNGSELKFFMSYPGSVELFYPGFRVLMMTDQPWWGIWFNRGGWPEKSPQPLCCLGVEATNTPGEYPADHWINPNIPFSGKVKLELHFESGS